jgi:hypothetical protein
MTVAFLHLAPELGALDRNRSLIEDATRVAAYSGADSVLSGERQQCRRNGECRPDEIDDALKRRGERPVQVRALVVRVACEFSRSLRRCFDPGRPARGRGR